MKSTATMPMAIAMTSEVATAWRKEHRITIRAWRNDDAGVAATATSSVTETIDVATPTPFLQWKETPFSPTLQEAMKCNGFLAAPTPLQSQVWPIVVAASRGKPNKDIMCIAPRGHGQTYDYLLPLFHQHHQQVLLECAAGVSSNTTRSPTMLVLAPSRSCVIPIMYQAQSLGCPLGITCRGITSSTTKDDDDDDDIDCVIATPLGLNDGLSMGTTNLSNVKVVVLAKADCMLDMGFEPHLWLILKHLPDDKRTLLFSEGLPTEIQRLASEFLQDPIMIQINSVL